MNFNTLVTISGHPIYNKPMGIAPLIIGGLMVLGFILYLNLPTKGNLSKKTKLEILEGWFWLIVSGFFIISIFKSIVSFFTNKSK
jgi:hypothetical protein